MCAHGPPFTTQAADLDRRLEGAPYAQADLFRVEDRLVVEHWDAAEAIAPASEWVNSGKF